MLYLQTDKNFKCDGTEIVHDIKTVIGKYGGDDTFVIGGGEVYRQLCRTVTVHI